MDSKTYLGEYLKSEILNYTKFIISYNSGKLCKHENQKNRLKAVFWFSKIK